MTLANMAGLCTRITALRRTVSLCIMYLYIFYLILILYFDACSSLNVFRGSEGISTLSKTPEAQVTCNGRVKMWL
jgi:hypothetical protein